MMRISKRHVVSSESGDMLGGAEEVIAAFEADPAGFAEAHKPWTKARVDYNATKNNIMYLFKPSDNNNILKKFLGIDSYLIACRGTQQHRDDVINTYNLMFKTNIK